MLIIKKLLVLILVLIITLSLGACGGETNNTIESSNTIKTETMVDVTSDLGISLKLPSDMPFQEINGQKAYINTETGDSVVVMVSEIGETPLSVWTEQMLSDTYKLKYDDVVIKSFENGKQINGREALESILTLTTPKGNAITMALVMITDGTKNYAINLTHGSDNTDGSLVKNLQAVIDSITIEAA